MTLSDGPAALLWAISASPTLLFGLVACVYLLRERRRSGLAASVATTLGGLFRVVWCAIRPFEDEASWSNASVVTLRVFNCLSIVCVAAWGLGLGRHPYPPASPSLAPHAAAPTVVFPQHCRIDTFLRVGIPARPHH